MERPRSHPGSVSSIKIVYWGPGRSGKTANLVALHDSLRPELRGRLITLDGPGERTLYFDCLPLEMNGSDGGALHFRLYTVPGQPRFQLTRRLVVPGIDGLVFVWDSRAFRLAANLASLREARETVHGLGRSWEQLPRVFQYNRQDCPGRLLPEHLDEVLAAEGEGESPRLPAVAVQGRGVREALGAIARAALRRRLRPVGLPEQGAAGRAPQSPTPAMRNA